MLLAIVFALSILISSVDIRTHKISNRFSGMLALVLALDPHTRAVGFVLISIALALVVTLLLRAGMGDFKLVVALLLSQSSIIFSRQYLLLFIAMATLFVISAICRRIGPSGSIAFGPVILLPFTAIYLAI